MLLIECGSGECVTESMCWMQVLYMGNNSVKDWGEFMKLVSIRCEVADCARVVQ